MLCDCRGALSKLIPVMLLTDTVFPYFGGNKTSTWCLRKSFPFQDGLTSRKGTLFLRQPV